MFNIISATMYAHRESGESLYSSRFTRKGRCAYTGNASSKGFFNLRFWRRAATQTVSGSYLTYRLEQMLHPYQAGILPMLEPARKAKQGNPKLTLATSRRNRPLISARVFLAAHAVMIPPQCRSKGCLNYCLIQNEQILY